MNLYDIGESRTMIETLILILKAVGLVCLISLAVVVTLSIIVWIIWSVIDGIRYSDGWHF